MKSETSKFSTQQHVERRRAQWRASYHRHKLKYAETRREAGRKRHLENRDKDNARSLAWNKSHPYSTWSEEQKQRSRDKYKKWYFSHHESVKARSRSKAREEYKSRSGKILERNKKWAKENPDIKKEISQRRRARRLKATVNPEKISAWMKTVRLKSSVRCYYCGDSFNPFKIHFDHIKPLSKGGSHSIENICISCPSCNLRKGTNLVSDWIRDGQQVLGV